MTEISWRSASTPATARRLRDLQGNILKGHGRKHVRLLFLHFNVHAEDFDDGTDHSSDRRWLTARDFAVADAPSAARLLLREIAPMLTNAYQQLEDTEMRRATGRPSSPFVSLGLTAAGFKALGLPGPINQPAFDGGMRRAGAPAVFATLGLAPRVQPDHPTPAVHAMLLLADGEDPSDDGPVQRLETTFRALVSKRQANTRVPTARVTASEAGTALVRGDSAYEHFGYAEPKSSHPLFIREDIESARSQEGDDDVYPRALDPARVLRRFGRGEGSFLVYAKIEQHIRAFRTHVESMADPTIEKELADVRIEADAVRLEPLLGQPMTPATRFTADSIRMRLERLMATVDAVRRPFYATKAGALAVATQGARIVGRFENGTSLAVSDEPALSPASNNFTYAGPGCPVDAHTRIVNNRDAADELRRFPRRSIPYDYRPIDARTNYPTPGAAGGGYQNLVTLPDHNVGLHFMAYNSDIADQFETVLGRQAGGRPDALLRPEFVTFLDGHYFFVPPIGYLASL